MPEEIKNITEEPKKRGRKKKVVEPAAEAVVEEIAEAVVDEVKTEEIKTEEVVAEPVVEDSPDEVVEASDANVLISEPTPEVEEAKPVVEESKTVNKQNKKSASYIGKKIIANPPIKIHRGPSDAVSAKSFSGQITILSDPVNGWTKVRYTRAAVGAAVGFARLSEAELKRARS